MWSRRAIPVFLMLLACPWAGAQEAERAWYVVRPGDTIEGLTTRYLGSRERWEENAELNEKRFPDPHAITPGEHIQLLLPEKLPDGALLTKVSRRVQGQPTPLTWIDAREMELLRARDGVKTGDDSSAQLEFSDETFLLLTEQSLVFLGERAAAPAPVDRTQIEIVVGQADLEGTSAATETGEFEIVIGDARATPRASEDAGLQTRARRPQSGGAQLMVYSGESELEAAGAMVTVATGEGSSVPEGEPPAPPEKLLPAPDDLQPAAGSGLATPRPAFGWATVDGARDYTLEVCQDPRCGKLVERVTGLSEPSWRPAGLPVEKLYWRVTAVSASGLDGYPSEGLDFEILSAVEDTSPPEVRIGFAGPRLLAPRFGLNDRWIVGPGTEVEVEAEDSGSGVDQWTPMIDGEEVAKESLRGPWSKGERTVSVVASDRAGNRSRTEVPFIFDPDPPELSWGVEGSGSALGSIAGAPSEDLGRLASALRGRRKMRVGKLGWRLDSDLAEVVIRPQTRKPIFVEGLGPIGSKNGLWVLADDKVCDELDSLIYELIAGAERGDYELWIKAVDCVGNAVVGQLSLASRKSKRR